jgi:hypothetical protein
MKLERIKAADQTEFPKTKPLSRSQSVSKRSALQPERKRIAETIATRILPKPWMFAAGTAKRRWQSVIRFERA